MMAKKKQGEHTSKADILMRKIIKHKLEEFKQANNLTQEQIAKKLKISKGQMSKIFNEKTTPSNDLCTDIATLLGVPLLDLSNPTEDFFSTDLHTVLSVWLAELDWSIDRLHQETGISPTQLSKFLNNEELPTPTEQSILLTTLQIPINISTKYIVSFVGKYALSQGMDSKRIAFLTDIFKRSLENDPELQKLVDSWAVK